MLFNHTSHPYSFSPQARLVLGLLLSLLLWLPHSPSQAGNFDLTNAHSYPASPFTNQTKPHELAPNSIEVAQADIIELIQNGDFEAGRDGSWAEYTWLQEDDLIVEGGFPVTPHSGSKMAWLGEQVGIYPSYETTRLSQTITIPYNIQKATFKYYYYIYSEQSDCDDRLHFRLISPTRGYLKAESQLICATHNSSGWNEVTYDLPVEAYAGLTLIIEFEVQSSGNGIPPNSILIDDVSLTVEPTIEQPLPPDKIYLPVVFGGNDRQWSCTPRVVSPPPLPPGTYDTVVGRPDQGQFKATVIVGKNYDPSKPTYLVLYLHGSEQNYQVHKPESHPVHQIIDEQGWVYVAPLAWEWVQGYQSWAANPRGNIDPLYSMLRQLMRDYSLCDNTMLSVGISDGAAFLDTDFFPIYGWSLPMHMLLICGSNATDLDHLDLDERAIIFGKRPDLIARSRFHYAYGSDDFLYDSIQNGIKVYREGGFNVIDDKVDGVGHCLPDSHLRVAQFLKGMAQELE